jgi:hypothetical protein
MGGFLSLSFSFALASAVFSVSAVAGFLIRLRFFLAFSLSSDDEATGLRSFLQLFQVHRTRIVGPLRLTYSFWEVFRFRRQMVLPLRQNRDIRSGSSAFLLSVPDLFHSIVEFQVFHMRYLTDQVCFLLWLHCLLRTSAMGCF